MTHCNKPGYVLTLIFTGCFMAFVNQLNGQDCQTYGELGAKAFEYERLSDSVRVSLSDFIKAFPKDFQTFENVYSFGSEYYGCSRDHLSIIRQNINDSACIKALVAVSIGANRFPDGGGDLHDLLRVIARKHTMTLCIYLNRLKDKEIVSIFLFLEKDLPRARRFSPQMIKQINEKWPRVGKCYSLAIQQLGEPDY